MSFASWSLRMRNRLTRLVLMTRLRRKFRLVLTFIQKAPTRLRSPEAQSRAFLILTRITFIIILVLLLVCTVIDVLKQSFSSGQFWNAIIVIIALAILAAYSFTLSLLRRVNTARWLAAIPRRRQVGRLDVGSKMVHKINETQLRCNFLFKNQLDFSTVSHPGAQNPLRRNKDERAIEVPFWEIADTIPNFFEGNVTVMMPDFRLQPGQSLREYVELVVNENLIDSEFLGEEVREFIDLYEVLRYSGTSVTYNDLLRMMSALVAMNSHLQPTEYTAPSPPASAFDTSRNRRDASSSAGSSLASVMIHEPPPFTPPRQTRHNSDTADPFSS